LLFNRLFFWPVFYAFGLFCLLTSGVYFLNDIIDINRDRSHPFKKYRPIAAGHIPIPSALVTSLSLIFFSLVVGFYLSTQLFLIMLAYVLLQLAYSIKLKHVPIFDIFSIAFGFLFRVYAGAVVVNLHLSVWLLICITAFSLFIAAAKRRSELVLKQKKAPLVQRPVFKYYNLGLLDNYISMFANTTWLAYTLFAYFYPVPVVAKSLLPLDWFSTPTFYTQKWLLITVPFVIYGVMRYLLLIYHYHEGESPARTLIKDKPLLITVLIWVVLTVVILDVIY